jgi:hypothetical protein
MTTRQIKKRAHELCLLQGPSLVYLFATHQQVKDWQFCRGCNDVTPRARHECLLCGQTDSR